MSNHQTNLVPQKKPELNKPWRVTTKMAAVFSGQIRYLDEYLDDLTSIKKNLGLIQAPWTPETGVAWGESLLSLIFKGLKLSLLKVFLIFGGWL